MSTSNTPTRTHAVDLLARAMNDVALTWKARGLLAFLVHHRERCPMSERDVVAAGDDGAAAVRTGLEQLAREGYVMLDGGCVDLALWPLEGGVYESSRFGRFEVLVVGYVAGMQAMVLRRGMTIEVLLGHRLEPHVPEARLVDRMRPETSYRGVWEGERVAVFRQGAEIVIATVADDEQLSTPVDLFALGRPRQASH